MGHLSCWILANTTSHIFLTAFVYSKFQKGMNSCTKVHKNHPKVHLLMFFASCLHCWHKLQMNVHFILHEALYIVLFDLKLLNEDSNWQVCMYCMHVRKGQKPPEHTSEHVKSQFFFGGGERGIPPAPPCTIYRLDPTFCICPGSQQPFWQPCTR